MSAVRTLVNERRVVITAGSGGVGKTTTAAAIALGAAQAGRRVAVLTIDPARRLASALGLDAFAEQARRVDRAHFERAGLEVRGELWAMMLDTKATADNMVRRFAPDAEAAARILDNRYYQAFSTYLAGTQEYMAIDRVCGLVDEGGYDLVVLDTPPAVHALDFLDAPERLLEALDNRAVNWLYRARNDDPGFGARLLGRARRVITRSLDTFTGGPFFEDLATFLTAFSALFEAFKTRSRRVHELLRAQTTAFVVVTAPNPANVVESLHFARQLRDRGLPFGAFVCNRVHLRLPEAPPISAIEADLRRALDPKTEATASLARDLHRALVEHNLMAARDAGAVKRLLGCAGEPPAIVPLFPEDVHDLRGLDFIARHLVRRPEIGNFAATEGVPSV